MSVLRARHDGEAAVMAEINITPFTDVLLVLLIIFMILAALVVPPGFERRFAPCACAPVRAPAAKPIQVVVSRHAQILVDGSRVTPAALYPLLVRLHERAPRAKLALFADGKAPYGTVIVVLDAAKAAGIADVSFVTQ